MNKRNHRVQTTADSDVNYDDLLASLLILITHHSLTQCNATLPKIVERLQQLCNHSELEFFPNQQTVLAKMQQLWRTQLFDQQFGRKLH